MLKDILSKFFEGERDVLFCYLYGSMNPRSDVDIAIYIDEGRFKKGMDIDYEVRLARLLKRPVDVRIINNLPIEMRYSVQKGILVFERDRKKRIEFEVKTRRDYFDFLPVLRIYFEVTKKKIQELIDATRSCK